MKHYPQTYEKVITNEAEIKKACDIEQVGVTEDCPFPVDELVNHVAFQMRDFEEAFFEHAVRLEWLRRKMTYKGAQLRSMAPSPSGHAWTTFCRSIAAQEPQFYSCATSVYRKIAYYLNDLFPGFDAGNPFTDPAAYTFPYDVVTPSHLVLIYQMDERMELLAHAEKEKMIYPVFFDYILNYISSANELGDGKFRMIFSKMFMPYVKNVNRYQQLPGQTREYKMEDGKPHHPNQPIHP